MFKRILKKSTLFLAALAICTSFVPKSVFAATVKETTPASVTISVVNPKEVVTNYLEAVKSSNVDKAVSILKEDGITEDQQKDRLYELLDDSSTKIAAIKDVKLENKTSTTATLSVTIQYEDGSIIKSPVSLEKQDGQYKFKRITADENVIKKATKTSINTKTNTSNLLSAASYSQTKVIDFDITQDAGTKGYSDDVFTDYNATYVQVNAWAGAKVEACIVKYGIFSDTELTDKASFSGSYNFKLTLKSGKTFKNASLRIYFMNDANCYGEVYTIS